MGKKEWEKRQNYLIVWRLLSQPLFERNDCLNYYQDWTLMSPLKFITTKKNVYGKTYIEESNKLTRKMMKESCYLPEIYYPSRYRVRIRR